MLRIERLKSPIELVSFHSISKGMIGECGRRGGYFECVNLDAEVQEQLYKLASISLCPTVQGQLMVDLMVQPPQPGDPSFPLYNEEMSGIKSSLKRRAVKLAKAFNEMESVSCQDAEGAMYLFPRVHLPQKAIDAARAFGKQPDAFYCMEMLNATGVVCVPGSGFGQKEGKLLLALTLFDCDVTIGTYHFRSTFLPPEDRFDDFISRIAAFHNRFMQQYTS